MDVVLPKWGVTMQEATLTEWLVAVGQTVTEGQPLATVETDKVDGEIESPGAGVLTSHLVAVGEAVAVGTTIAVVE
jgi:pyruvate/2-oxoglutarate dehydrogenase complex dihydrolipoamide acyltransferase (E2) component